MATVITQTANPAGVSASANVATYTAASIGTAAPNRIVVVLVGSELASTPIASCTIGGNAMTAGTQGNQGAVYARAFYLLYPTGTTADIAVTFTTNSPTSTQNHIAVYTVVGGTYSSTGADKSTDMDSTDPLTTGSISIASGGGFIAVAASATDTNAKSWANATEDIDADGGALRFTTATRTTSLTTTAVTCTGTTNGEDGALSYFIFGANTSPTVALNSPADSATGVSTTPVLDFTGTDAESNDVRYEVQVATSTFVDIAHDADSNSGIQTATNYNFNHTCTGTNLILFVGVAVRQGSYYSASAVTYNGVSMTRIRHDDNGAGNSRGSEIWYLINPATGTHAVDITISQDVGGGSYTGSDAHAVSFTGAKQSGVPDSQNGEGEAAATSHTTPTTTVANNSWIVSMFNGGSDDGATPTSPMVASSVTNNTGNHTGALGYQGPVSPAGATNSTWTVTSDTSAMSVVSFAPATTPVIDAVSGTDAGFANPDVGGDTDPFTSGDNIQYTVQSALSNSTVYYWRVRGIDPAGSNSYGAWATTRSFTTTAAGGTVVKDMMGMGMIPFPR